MPIFGPDIQKMKDRGDIQELMEELRNKDVKVRIAVIKALTTLKQTNALWSPLFNDIAEVRVEAIKGLQEIGHEEAIACILQCFLTDKNNLIRDTALRVLVSVDKKTLVSVIDKASRKFSIPVADGLELCNRLVEINSSDERLWCLKGWFIFCQGDYREALDCIGQALKMNPASKIARQYIARIARSRWNRKASEWRDLKRQKELLAEEWRRLQETKIYSLLKGMYEAFKWKYKKYLDWKEKDYRLVIR